MNSHTADVATSCFHCIHPLFIRIHMDLIGELKSICHDPEFSVDVTRNVSVIQVSAQCVHPVLDACRDSDPDTSLRIAENEIDLATRFTFNAGRQHMRFAGTCHDFQTVRAKVGDENVSTWSECQ